MITYTRFIRNELIAACESSRNGRPPSYLLDTVHDSVIFNIISASFALHYKELKIDDLPAMVYEEIAFIEVNLDNDQLAIDIFNMVRELSITLEGFHNEPGFFVDPLVYDSGTLLYKRRIEWQQSQL